MPHADGKITALNLIFIHTAMFVIILAPAQLIIPLPQFLLKKTHRIWQNAISLTNESIQ